MKPEEGPTITTFKMGKLRERLISLAMDLERIQVEVEVLRDANIAMAKTIRANRYAGPD